jgi:hypothetical protein
MREVITAKRSRFLLCQLAEKVPAFEKYPPQPIMTCSGFEKVAQE